MSIKEQLIELGNKYIELEKELEEGAKILENYKNNLIKLLKEDDRTGYESTDENLWINMKEQEKFDSKKFKKDNSDLYEEFRIEQKPQKKFDKKQLKQKHPSIYKDYCKIVSELKVKRIK